MAKKKNFIQFIKYTLIGSLNVLIDFVILNILWFITGMYQGYMNYIFKFLSFLVYSTNGYLMNKKFTFDSNNKSYFKYIFVLGIATIINAFILSNLSMHNILNLKPILWSNISALIASIATGILSFLVNKLFVFK